MVREKVIPISIIVPFYNVSESLFYACCQSIKKQTYAAFEVVIVDDGSEPEYAKMIDHFAARDDRFQVIHQENRGVSGARNVGIQYAKGEYIAFIDPDDEVTPEYLEQAEKYIRQYDADYVIGGIKQVDFDFSSKYNHKNEYYEGEREAEVYSKKNLEALKRLLISRAHRITIGNDGVYIGRGPVARLIRADIVKKQLFPEELSFGEDMIWNYRVLCTVKKAVVVHQIWYYYRKNANSINQKYNEKIFEEIDKQHKALIQFIDFKEPIELNLFCSKFFENMRSGYRCFLGNRNCNLNRKRK